MGNGNGDFILCGGTFLTLVLQSRKPTTVRRQRIKGQAESFCEQDVLLGLIKIVNPEYSKAQGNTFKTDTSNFKNCKIDVPESWDFDNDLVISAFKERLKNDYVKLLEEMGDFISDYIDLGSTKKQDVLLVKRLIELINADNGLEAYRFVVSREGVGKGPGELMEVTEVDLAAFLLSIWSFIVTVRCRQNKIGRDTISAWFPDEKEPKAQAKYKGINGKSIGHEIHVYSIKAVEDEKDGRDFASGLAYQVHSGASVIPGPYIEGGLTGPAAYGKKAVTVFISMEQFHFYHQKLYSAENSIVKIALQEFFFKLEQGYILYPKCREKLDEALVYIITKNTSDRVRRWAYMVASFGPNTHIVKAARENLKKEVNDENRTWIIALISKVTQYDEFIREMKKCDYGLSLHHMLLSSYLFSDYPILDQTVIKKIISNGDDRLSLFWLGSITAYFNIRKRARKENMISDSAMYELTAHDDPEVAEHYIGAIWKQDKYSISKMRINYDKYKEMDYRPKKWFLTAVWRDIEFINKNRDYIKELLGDEHLFKYCDGSVREGIARGLSSYGYDAEIVWEVLHWFSYEPSESVKFFLHQYINRHKEKNSNYFELISANGYI